MNYKRSYQILLTIVNRCKPPQLTPRMLRKVSFIFIGAIVLLASIYSLVERRAKTELIKAERISLPKFRATNYLGGLLDSYHFSENLFIIFINSDQEYHFELLSNVYKNYFKKDLRIISFTKNRHLSDRLKYLFPGIFIVLDSDGKYENLFHAKSCCGRHYLYDRSKKLIASTNNTTSYDEGIKVNLRELFENIKFDISMLIPENNISKIPDFQDAWKSLQFQQNKYFIIMMISEACDSCLTRGIVEEIKAIHKNNPSSIGFLILLSNDFDENDVKNFKISWNISFDVEKATGLLADRWNYLIHYFRRSDLNNIVLLLDKKGLILELNENVFRNIKKYNNNEEGKIG